MEIQRLHVLLIEDNATDALLVEAAFEEMAFIRADVVAVERLSQGLACLEEVCTAGKAPFDVVLLDLNLPDNDGLQAVERVALAAPDVPIIALTGLADESRALEALHLGASDYLVKGQGDASMLERSIRYAIERKRSEKWRLELARAQHAQAEAEEASRAKDQFLATLSHELRTPLNSILGWAYMMRSGALSPEESKDALEVIERNARAQAKLVEDLLDVSRFIAGKMALESAPLDFAAVVQRGVEDVLPAANEKELTTSIETEPAQLNGDASRLQQVVSNLLTNAVKFTPAGGKVDVRVMTENHRALLQVRDSGEGIAPEFLPHVFDRFLQADGSPTRRHGGLGLGLAIVRTIAELHGGSVSVTSEGEGQGATFTVDLPLAA